jgi:hypothetical protein
MQVRYQLRHSPAAPEGFAILPANAGPIPTRLGGVSLANVVG